MNKLLLLLSFSIGLSMAHNTIFAMAQQQTQEAQAEIKQQGEQGGVYDYTSSSIFQDIINQRGRYIDSNDKFTISGLDKNSFVVSQGFMLLEKKFNPNLNPFYKSYIATPWGSIEVTGEEWNGKWSKSFGVETKDYSGSIFGQRGWKEIISYNGKQLPPVITIVDEVNKALEVLNARALQELEAQKKAERIVQLKAALAALPDKRASLQEKNKQLVKEEETLKAELLELGWKK